MTASPAQAQAAEPFRPCVVVPTYDNPRTIRGVVEAARLHVPDVLVVDDGSGAAGEAAVHALETDGLARVRRRAVNGGKGAAVKEGLRFAAELGFTHAVQVDADGQHDASLIPTFVAAAVEEPTALVLGYPVYDGTVPRGRLWARKITSFWVFIETGGRAIRDAMVGFRVYPVARALAARARADRMDFDIEIAVRMAWDGRPIVNLPTPVRYLSAEEGGVSHFQLFRDNVRITWLHTRLTTVAVVRRLLRLFGLGRSIEARS